jgi:hypothetical protein
MLKFNPKRSANRIRSLTIGQWSFLDDVPSWDKLHRMSESHLFRLMTPFVMFVPIAAKAMTSIPSQIRIPTWDDQSITLHLALPFSWHMFFFAGLCVLIGRVIDAARCPRIVKALKLDGSDSCSKRQVAELCAAFVRSPIVWLSASDYCNVEEFMESLTKGTMPDSSATPYLRADRGIWMHDSAGVELMDRLLTIRDQSMIASIIRSYAVRSRLVARLCCAIFFWAAYTLLALVTAQGACWVLKYSLS